MLIEENNRANTTYVVSKDMRIMRTNIDINEELIEKAMALTGSKTKNEVIHFALEELVRKHRLKKFADRAGKIKWEES